MAFDVSKINIPLGFGCMRFEGRADDTVDIAQVSEMIDCYMEAGGNYFDTAWAYPNSEKTLRKALVERHPRDSYLIASKCVAWSNCTCKEDLEMQLQETLATLGIDYVDVYLMHNLGGTRTASFEKFDAWEFVKSVKERGLAKHIGFSAHCTPDELEGFIAAYPEAEIIQLQANYSDWDSPDFRARRRKEIPHKGRFGTVGRPFSWLLPLHCSPTRPFRLQFEAFVRSNERIQFGLERNEEGWRNGLPKCAGYRRSAQNQRLVGHPPRCAEAGRHAQAFDA